MKKKTYLLIVFLLICFISIWFIFADSNHQPSIKSIVPKKPILSQQEPLTEAEKKRIQQCGDIDLSQPHKEIVHLDLSAIPFSKSGSLVIASYKVTINGLLQFRTDLTQSTSTTILTITDVTPRFIKSLVAKEVNKMQGSVSFVFVSLKKRASLVQTTGPWNNIVCTLQPVKEVHNNFGNNNVKTQFSPPLPFVLSPLANAIVYKSEIGKRKVWKSTATVITSNNSIVPAGTRINGEVIVQPIKTTFTCTLPDGQEKKIVSEGAYEILTNFGERKVTSALGLEEITRYYLNHSNKTITAFTIVDQDSQTIAFISQQKK